MLPAHDPGTPETGEILLWRAHFALCLYDLTSAQENRRKAALRWVKRNSNHIGFFCWCCQVLGLDDMAVRQKLLRGVVLPATQGRARRPAQMSLPF